MMDSTECSKQAAFAGSGAIKNTSRAAPSKQDYFLRINKISGSQFSTAYLKDFLLLTKKAKNKHLKLLILRQIIAITLILNLE